MYAVLCNPVFWREIDQTVSSKGGQVLVKAIENDIDIISEFEKIGRNPIKHLIIDLIAVKDTKKVLYAIKRYRVKNDKTQIIIIAPNIAPPNFLMNALVTMGIYDIIAPKAENLEDIILLPSLVELIDNPSSYKKAVRWFMDIELTEEKQRVSKSITQDKISEPLIIEKKIIIEREIISDSIISFLSNSSNGKSFLSWNLAHAFAKNDYKVAYINLDDYNSANSFFQINENKIAFKNLTSKTLNQIVEDGYKVNKNLTVYTGEFSKKTYIPNDSFFKFLGMVKAENNIVIIDTSSLYNENLNITLQYSDTILVVFDLCNLHFKMNLILLDKIKALINKKKAIALMNNVYEKSKEINSVKKAIDELEIFKDILTISNCGDTTYDYCYSNTCNYLSYNNNFTEDLDTLLKLLKIKNEGEKISKKKIFNFFSKK